MIHVLKNDILTVTISSYGAEIISAKGKDGHEYIWSGKEWADHAPILFPICGKILDGKYTVGGKEYRMAGHGFAKRSEFVLTEGDDSHAVFTLTENEDTLGQYPFAFKLTAAYTLDGHSISAVFTVENRSDKVMPFMLGWHPGFTLGGGGSVNNFTVDFGKVDSLPLNRLQNGPFVNPVSEIYPLDGGKYHVCDAEIAENDTLIFHDTLGYAVLGDGDPEHRVTIRYGENIPYFCIWKYPGLDTRFICLEPWSGVPADGVTPENFDTRRMSRLECGASEAFAYSVDLE